MNVRRFPQSRLFRAAVTILVLAVVSLWGPEPVAGFFRGTFHTVFLPLEKGFSAIAFRARDVGTFLSSIGELKSENDRLREDNLRLRAENATLASLRTENEELKASVGLESGTAFDLVPGRAVAEGSERGFMLIDRGRTHGVGTGMPVLSFSGAVIGIVSESYPFSARITLLSHSESAIGGVTVEQGVKGIVRGDRGLGIAFSMVLRNDPLATGDRIVTSGSGSGIPPGLFIGTVSSVTETEDRLFREASVMPPQDISDLRFLFVVKGKGEGV